MLYGISIDTGINTYQYQKKFWENFEKILLKFIDLTYYTIFKFFV